jgi:hypothetical protein
MRVKPEVKRKREQRQTTHPSMHVEVWEYTHKVRWVAYETDGVWHDGSLSIALVVLPAHWADYGLHHVSCCHIFEWNIHITDYDGFAGSCPLGRSSSCTMCAKVLSCNVNPTLISTTICSVNVFFSRKAEAHARVFCRKSL